MEHEGSAMDRRAFLRGAGSAALALSLFPLFPNSADAESGKRDFDPHTPEGEIETVLSKAGNEVKERYETLVKNFNELLADPQQRRELLHDMSGKLITLGANAPHMYSLALDMTYGILGSGDADIPYADVARPESTESLSPNNALGMTDTVHPRTKALAEYRNLGVTHSGGPIWEAQKDLILSAIQEADIVLLEHGDPGWFSQLKRYAQYQGKDVRYIEGGGGMGIATVANALALWCVVDMLQLNPLKQSDRGAWTKELAKAWLYQQFGLWPVSAEVESVARRKLSNDAYSGRFSFDFKKDARTIWMMIEIQKIRRDPDNTDKKILSISGDIHAQGFELYDDNKAELLLKRILYNTAFCLHHAADLVAKK